MPSSFNAFFRPSSSRRSSAAVPPDEAGASQLLAEQQSLDGRSADGSTVARSEGSTDAPSSSPSKGRSQKSLPPLSTGDGALTREVPTKSSSVPSIEIVSPSGNKPRHLWGPGEDSDQNSNASPPLGALGPASDHGFQSFSPRSQSTISRFEPRSHSDEPEEEDPLFSVSPSQKKMARPNSSSGKSGRGGDGVMAAVKRSSRVDAPDRHDIMRRAMAEATSADTFGTGSPDAVRTDERMLNDSQGIAAPHMTNRVANRSADRNAGKQITSSLPASQSTGTIIDHDKPGEGSLTFDHFAGSKGEGEMILADGSNVTSDAGTTPMMHNSSQEKDRNGIRGFPSRPKLGSRNNSFQSDVADPANDVHDSPTGSVFGQGTHSTATSPVKSKTPGHGRYATTGHVVEPVRSKQTSLAIPGSNGTLEATSNARHNMQESASTSLLLPSPLSRFRRLSDASSAYNGKKNAAPSGGIAGALAASGLAGMGVGHAELLQRSQAQLSEREAAAAAAAASKKARSRTSSVGSAYAAGYEGGVYRDPVTGKMTERGPGNELDELSTDVRPRPQHSRSTTMNSSNASFDGSDISAASGLNAAANFALGLHGGDLLSPEDPLQTINGGEQSPLTPSGIGAVGGLSPSGLGERVAVGDEDWHGAHDMGAQITGFAVASSKRNADFHGLFPVVPEDDYLIEDYGCALVREILIQGRLYVSENHVCFYANIFGWVTNIVLPFSEIVSVEKRMTAYVIPNAIQVATLHSKSTFASFLSRDTTYDLIVNIWKLSHPALRPAESFDVATDEESVDAADGATVVHADNEAEKPKQETDQTPAKKSKRKLLKKKLGIKDGGGAHAHVNDQTTAADAAAISRGKSPAPGAKRQPHRKTMCSCGKDKKHFNTVVLDTTYPAVPEKLYNLIFTSGFMKDFWTENQKLLDLHMSDWAPNMQNDNTLSRDISYIKPLAGGFGPKQTKCLLTDENFHVNFDEFITTMTTTRTPDVPSGGSFSVKTRTCITWDGGNVSRIVVTCMVEWTGRSMLKSVIDRACIDGQKQYYKDLDAAIRSYIKEHASEFREDGEDPDAAVAAITEHADSEGADEKAATASKDPSSAEGEKTGLANFIDQLQPVVDIASGAFGSLTELSPNVLILGAVVVLLIISNLWALSSGSGRDPLDPHRLRTSPTRSAQTRGSSASHHHLPSMHEVGSSAEAVAGAVRDVLRDYFEPHGLGRIPDAESTSPKLSFEGETQDPAVEIRSLLGLLDDVEARVSRLRTHLQQIEHKQD